MRDVPVPIAELEARQERARHEYREAIEAIAKRTKGVKRAREMRDAARAHAEKAQKADDSDLAQEFRAEADTFEKRMEGRGDVREQMEKRASRLKKAISALDRRIEKARRRPLDAKGACVDGCSMPVGLKLLFLGARKHGWNGVVNSADRTVAHCDDCSNKQSQAELWNAFQNGTGAPANPPGQGSHEYRNGGTPAYATKFAAGAELPWWGLGTDITDPLGFIAACRSMGIPIHRAYLPRESWHTNVSADPSAKIRALR